MEDARGSSWYRSEMIRVFVARAMEGLRSDA
jgi:CO/xanthine dehydrogenase FAD-binding subunit